MLGTHLSKNYRMDLVEIVHNDIGQSPILRLNRATGQAT